MVRRIFLRAQDPVKRKVARRYASWRTRPTLDGLPRRVQHRPPEASGPPPERRTSLRVNHCERSDPSMPSKKVTEPEPFDKRSVDFSKFKTDLTLKDYRKLFGPKGGVIFPFFSIEILSPTKTIGKGRTNLTIIRPTIVQIDTPVPFASFDRRESPTRDPVIQMHFEPIAYGITTVTTYIMEFAIQAFQAVVEDAVKVRPPGLLLNIICHVITRAVPGAEAAAPARR